MASVISRYIAPYALQMTKFADKANKKLIPKIVIAISKAVQKSLRYFNGTVISISRATPSSVNFDLNWNDLESSMLWLGSALQYCSKLTDVLKKYCCSLLKRTLAIQHLDLCQYMLVCY